MRVHLIKQQTLDDFAFKHSASKAPLCDWAEKVKFADWNEPNNIKETFNTADLIGKSSNRVVFDIGGNNFRMICKYFFGEKEVHLFICWIGMHSAYDKICKHNEQYTINIY